MSHKCRTVGGGYRPGCYRGQGRRQECPSCSKRKRKDAGICAECPSAAIAGQTRCAECKQRRQRRRVEVLNA